MISKRHDQFLSLSPGQRRIVHEYLVERALARWRTYAKIGAEMWYRESVCGTEQAVDPRLPEEAVAAVRSGEGAVVVARRYGEPMAALQDEVDAWLIVNQAGASDEDEGNWERALAKAIEKAVSSGP